MKRRIFLLFLILLLAGSLRFYKLGENPPGLTWDEAAWGYNAYSLALDGRDEFGRFLPLDYLESFGDFKPTVYAYLTVLPVKIFGLNEFATRFSSAFFGVLTVLLVYFLSKEVFSANSPRRSPPAGGHRPRCLGPVVSLALIASFLLAISPWHIMLSRAAFEANVASFFLIGGVLFFLIGVRKKDWFLSLSVIFFALSLYTFNTSRLMAPFLLIGLGIGFFRALMKKKKWVFISLLVGAVLVLPLVPFLLTPLARLRFREVNIFSDLSVVILANQEMANDNWTWWSRLIHNRRLGYTREFLRHYLDHFNPAFLLIKGDGNPKFSSQDVGELYLWELPFLLLGTLFLFKKKPGLWWLIPYWLLIGIVPAATARETPHALRIETTLPTWQILTALGVVNFVDFLRSIGGKKIFKFLICVFAFLFLVFNFLYFLHGYWQHYPYEYSREWQYGYKEAVAYVKKVEDNYDKIWFTRALGRPYIYFLFYCQEPPENFRQSAELEREAFGFVKVKGFGKYYFGEESGQETGVLYVDLAQNVPSKAAVKQTFKLLNNQEILVAFEI